MKLAFALCVYIGAIVAANVMTVQLGQVTWVGLTVTAGTFAAGFALFARDFVQRYVGDRKALWVVLGGIAVAGALSWYYATTQPAPPPFLHLPDAHQIAIASTVAFASAELVDYAVYTRTYRRLGFAVAVAASALVAVPFDTVLFLWLSGFGLTWSAFYGQLAAKLIWATFVPLALYLVGQYALSRQPVDTAGA